VSTEAKHSAARAALLCVGLAAVAGAATLGLAQLRRYVLTQPSYANNRVVLVLADRPSWMDARLAEEIRRQLLPPRKGGYKTFDPQLVARVRLAAGNCPWIASLEAVRVDRVPARDGDKLSRAGRVVVRARWRRPAAIGVWVGPQGNRVACVDAEAVVLPNRQAMPIARAMRLPHVDTNAAPPPAPGQKWTGPHVATGLAMVKLLREHSEGERFTRIGIEGDDLMVTLRAGTGGEARVFCFGHLPLDDTLAVGEVSVERRLAYVEHWYAKEDHLYLDVPGYVDLRGREMTVRAGDVMAIGSRERIYR